MPGPSRLWPFSRQMLAAGGPAADDDVASAGTEKLTGHRLGRRGGKKALRGPAALVAASIALFAVLAFSGSAPAATAPSTSSSGKPKTSAISAGEELYNMHCESCHGANAVGGKGPELLNVGAAAVNFFVATGRMPLNAPTAQPLRHQPYFNPTQIKELVAYIVQIDEENGTPGPGIPTLMPVCAKSMSKNCVTLSEGNQLFLMNCAQCHDASGAGGMLSHGYVIPSLREATAVQVAEAIRVGPRPMPNFGPNELSTAQVSSIAQYVHYLSSTPDRGGLGIANFGPVPEGFVGVIFGLGILLLVARLMGNRG